MRECSSEVGERLTVLFDGAGEAIKAAEAFDLLGMAKARGVKRAAKDGKRFVVGLERHREWVAVLAAVREGETRGVGEAAGCAVHDFRNERERLQRARTEAFDEQQRGEVAKIVLVRYGEHRAETLEVDVCCAHVVVLWHDELASLLQ